MTGLVLAVMAAAGVYLAFTALALGWRDLAPAPSLARERRKAVRRARPVTAGLAGLTARAPAPATVPPASVRGPVGSAVFGRARRGVVVGQRWTVRGSSGG